MASSSRSSRGPADGARGLARGESGGLSVTHSHQLLQKVLVVATPGPQRRGYCDGAAGSCTRLVPGTACRSLCQCRSVSRATSEGVIDAPAPLPAARAQRCGVCAWYHCLRGERWDSVI